MKTLPPAIYLKRRRITDVVISTKQDMTLIPQPSEDCRFKHQPVASVKEAYEHMTKQRRITRCINRMLAKEARELLHEYCTPYVPPDIALEITARELASTDNAAGETHGLPHEPSGRPEYRPLKRWQKAKLIRGLLVLGNPGLLLAEDDAAEIPDSLPGHRVRIFADSGLGKSMFILRCEYAIAKADTGLLPLRLGRVTDIDATLGAIQWKTDKPDNLIDALADRFWPVLQRYRNDPEFCETAEAAELNRLQTARDNLRDWFSTLIEEGRVVFLLDALDQVPTDGVTGLGSFLGNGAPSDCPVIMTGRPESRDDKTDAFVDNRNWTTLKLLPFDEKRQRRYLGNLADQLIPKEEIKYWNSNNRDALRRDLWKDLLEVPLLLKMLKGLASGQQISERKLQDISSRHDLYQLAADQLIDSGWDSIQLTALADEVSSKERLKETLAQIAWWMAEGHTGQNLVSENEIPHLQSDLKLDESKLLNALKQIDVITSNQIFDQADATGLAFRHRSFQEFFAGCYLAGDERVSSGRRGRSEKRPRFSRKVQQKILDEIYQTTDDDGEILDHVRTTNHSRPNAWKDTLRFALSHATSDRRDELAIDLIERGDPWLVYQSMVRDGTLYASPIESLVRWLVHCDRNPGFDYSGAVRGSQLSRSDLISAARGALTDGNFNSSPRSIEEHPAPRKTNTSDHVGWQRLVDRSVRDAGYLQPLRELLPNQASLYAGISEERGLIARLKNLHASTLRWDFENSFVSVEGGIFDISQYEYYGNVGSSRKQINSFALADFPVTNELFELFSPTHRRHCDQYSNADDQPVVHVSWFMALEFCRWLSELTGTTYRLPNEWEWEFAVRDRNRLQAEHWWGEDMRDDLCWYGGEWGDGPAKSLQRTRSRSEAISAFDEVPPEDRHPSWVTAETPGILDALGNVWEWCENSYDESDDPAAPGSSRVLRGGSWYDYADNCRSASRNSNTPDVRNSNTGFRVCREL